MADLTGTKVHECLTVDELLEAVRMQPALFDGGITSTVLYRGVGNSEYDLVPMALRMDAKSKLIVQQIKSLDPENPNWIVDVSVLRLFYQEANRNGLAVLYVPQEYHDALAVAALTPNVNGNLFRQLLPVFGLAQHYGLPTRLLDWSFDVFVAAYFAAKSGTQKLLKQDVDPAKKIALWMVQSRFLSEEVQVVHTPYNGNPNLAAQRGAFTFVSHVNDASPLNVVSTNKEKRRKDFHKFTLPITQAPNLLLYLRTIGYDAGRIFPGYFGAATAVKELALLAGISAVTKRVFE
jgi:hypothetical protein